MKALLVLAIVASAHLAAAAVFYCDPTRGKADGDGSAERPWSTLEQVIQSKKIQLRDAGGRIANSNAPVRAGDTILLRSGKHGNILIRAGYNEQPITIAADAGHKPEIGWVDIHEGSRWVLRGLIISPSFAAGVGGRMPRNIVTLGEGGGDKTQELVVEDCFIHSVADASDWTAADWVSKALSGIWLGRSGSNHVARNNFILNTRFGINLCAPGCVAEGNVVMNFSADGVRATRDEQRVEYNVIKNIFVGDADGDKNHDDGIQVFLFNAGRGTVRDIVLRGNLIIARENKNLPFPANLQGIGCFDGPLVNFLVESNVVAVSHHHGVSLYDAQGCTIRGNACYNAEGGRLLPWVMLGQKRNQAGGNVVVNNIAHSFQFKADPKVNASGNTVVTGEAFQHEFSALVQTIEQKFGRMHAASGRGRLERN